MPPGNKNFLRGFLVFKIKFIKNLYDYGMISVKIIDEYKMK